MPSRVCSSLVESQPVAQALGVVDEPPLEGAVADQYVVHWTPGRMPPLVMGRVRQEVEFAQLTGG